MNRRTPFATWHVKHIIRSGAVVAVFAAIGLLSLQFSHAATYASSAETENGLLTGNATPLSDANASAGGAVQFGTTSNSSSCALPNFPDASCTGVPAGTHLTMVNGDMSINAPNTIVDSKDIHGCVNVTAPGVIIRNSRISCTSGGDVLTSGDGAYSGTSLLIEDSEVNCSANSSPSYANFTNGTAIGDTNITVRRVNIFGCENGFDLDQNIVIEDSYIHNPFNSVESHTDGIQFAFHLEGSTVVRNARNITISHNTIYGTNPDYPGGTGAGTSAIISNSGGDTNILIQNNLLAGGAFTLYCEQGATGINYRVLNNHFSRIFSSTVGAYGPSTDCSDETQSGNVIHETGQAITLQ